MITKGATNAFLFPGQGSQKPGMGQDIYEASEVAKALFDKANMVLDIDVKALCFDGTEDDLRKTDNTQPALFTVSMAFFEMVRAEGLQPAYTAGHSLGEFSALVAAGYLTFEDALQIVRKRGLIMASADPEGKGAMSAVLGLTPEKVKELCEQAGGDVVPANYNSPDQTVISGDKDAVAKVEELAKEAGAKRVVSLVVSGAFHSPLMKEAGEEFRGVLDAYEFFETPVQVLSNVTAQPHVFSEVKNRLVEQMYSPVRWVECMERLTSNTIDGYYEIGPNRVLAGLMRKINKEASVTNVGTLEHYEALVAQEEEA